MDKATTLSLGQQIVEDLKVVKKASRRLISLTDDQIANILNQLADLLMEEAAFLLAANQQDLDRMDPSNPKYDRLLLNENRLEQIAADLRKVAKLPSTLHKTLEEKLLPNGLQLRKVSVPLGMVGIVFESRPNVTFDVFALCLKSGNASILKGSRDAHYSNKAIVALIKRILQPLGLGDICYLAPSQREALPFILQADQFIDVLIPRGSQGLIDFVRENAKVPVIETGAGIVHTYFDISGDIQKGKAIIENAKSRRVSVCNALDTLLIHEARLEDLPELVHQLGQQHQCQIYADKLAYDKLTGNYPKDLLHLAAKKDFGIEFLSMKMSIKTVSSLEEALDHIAEYSSKHSEAIIAEEKATIDHYLQQVDAAVVYANAATSFTDGAQFGMGAEIGISTQKLHARGPMALAEMTSYKWVVLGDGHIRAKS